MSHAAAVTASKALSTTLMSGVIIDTSLMTGVRHDPDMRAFVIDSGTTLGEVYRRLFLDWGVTIPAGESPYLGLGAHVSGGAFGFLCRQHGLAADHLYGLEVVVVDADGTARSVVATREPSDPNRDLWWAHTGAGGGNFGIVTRCWFRSPGATGTDPARLLPKAPESVPGVPCRVELGRHGCHVFRAARNQFRRLVRG